MAKQKKQLTPVQQAFKKEYRRIMNAVKRAEKKGYIFDTEKLPQIPSRITQRSVAKLQRIKPVDLRKKAQKVDYETGELISGKKAIKLEKQEAKEKAKETRRQHKLDKELAEVRRESRQFEQDYINRTEDYELEGYSQRYDDYEDYKEQIEPIKSTPITTEDGYTVDPTTGEIISEPEPKHDREKYNKEHGLDKYKGKQPTTTPTQDDYPQFSTMVISNFRSDVAHFPALAEPMLNSWLDELIGQYGSDDVAEMLENAKASGIWIDYSVAYRKDLLLGMISDMMEYLPDASDWFKKDLAEKLEYSEDWESPD